MIFFHMDRINQIKVEFYCKKKKLITIINLKSNTFISVSVSGHLHTMSSILENRQNQPE